MFRHLKSGSRKSGTLSALFGVSNKASIRSRPMSMKAVTPEKALGTPPPSRMTMLANKIAKNTEIVERYMREQNLRTPSDEIDSPAAFPKLPQEIAQSRHEVLFATRELERLALGPAESVRWGAWDFLEVLALQAINYFGIAKLWPVDSTITLSELETKTTLDGVNLARLLRAAMTIGIFREPSLGVIAHTAASRVLAEDEDMQAWVGFISEDVFPAASRVSHALDAYPDATSPKHAGFNLAFGTVGTESMFVTFGRDTARARRLGRAMASLTGGEGCELSYLSDVEGGGYDFGDVNAAGGTLVDVGGSHGFVCVELARLYRNMRFVVQDLQRTVDSAPAPVCEDPQVASRVTLQAHDFFTEQPVKGADVYFFRWIVHNYSTPLAVRLLRNLVPALKPGARVLINEHCLLGPGQESAWDENIVRKMDLGMLALLNAQERTEDEFRRLFSEADPRFVFKGVTRPKGARMSIVEAVWQP